MTEGAIAVDRQSQTRSEVTRRTYCMNLTKMVNDYKAVFTPDPVPHGVVRNVASFLPQHAAVCRTTEEPVT